MELEDAAKDLYDARPTVDNPQLTQALEPLLRQLADIHKRLASIPALERKARAKLAENALEGTEEGRRILEQLTTVTDGALPRFMLDSK